MSKLNLVAMDYDRDKVLNAMQKTGATEIKLHSDAENTFEMHADAGELEEKLSYLEGALEILSRAAEDYFKQNKIKSDLLKDGFNVSYSQFLSAKKLKEEAEGCAESVYGLSDREKALFAELSRLKKTRGEAAIYSAVKEPLSYYSDTQTTRVKLGTVPSAAAEALTADADGLYDIRVLNISGDSALIACVAHKSDEKCAELLSGASFVACPFAGDKSGEELCSELDKRIEETEEGISSAHESLCALNPEIKKMKIYADYLRFEVEKCALSEKMRRTQTTFLLEAYVPKEAEGEVAAALDGVTGATYYEFSEPGEDEIPPTLYKNNAVVKNFESITDTYSPPNSRELDPNTVMAFFYSLFLGFIMGDIGYGLLMLIGGGVIYLKQKRDCGLKRLAGVFAIGGIFALIWGVLFNSLLGIPVLGFTVIPDAQRDMWTFAGSIKVPAVLVISLMIGVVQLFAGYICRAAQCWRRGKFADGVLDGVVWAVFSVGVGLAIVGFVGEANLPVLVTVGGITAGASLLVAVLTAGRKEKFLGKFTKGFGAAYGVINYASDILSYARLYGLMLSGAVIAQIISAYCVDPSIMGMEGVGFIFSGNIGLIILGAALMIAGHAFNLAIGLLGAYIHDARLQYVEFYGRFYEGEGELFSPLGSQQKYVYLSNNL